MKDSNCIFCKIANGEIPSRTLYEDEKYRVILDLGPATRGHALVLPKEHGRSLQNRKADGFPYERTSSHGRRQSHPE